MTGLGIISMISPGTAKLRERVHFDEAKEIAGVLALDQSLQGQCHALDVHVLAVVSHRPAHVHDHACGALRMIASLVDFDVFATQPDRSLVSLPKQRVDHGLRQDRCWRRCRQIRRAWSAAVRRHPHRSRRLGADHSWKERVH